MVAVRLVPSTQTRCAALAWRSQGRPFATVIAKITLAYGPDGRCLLDAPRAIVQRDEHLDKNPTRGLEDATDLVPYLGKGELLVRGAAFSATGSEVTAGVTVARDGHPILSRAFLARPAAGARTVALLAENARGGPGHAVNPVGSQSPQLLSPGDPGAPLLVGPIPRVWAARASLLKPPQRKALQQRELVLDEGFDWDFFHAAPREQRAATFFRGDEALALRHLDAERPELEVRLPGARVEAAWVKGPDQRVPLVMRCDTLRLDTQLRTITLSWRGFFEVAEGDAKMVVTVGVSLPGQPIEWPEISDEPESVEPESAPSSPAVLSLNSTGAVHLDGLNAPTTPFATPRAPAPSSRPIPSAPIPGAPFGREESEGRPTIELGSTIAASASAAPATPFSGATRATSEPPARPVASPPLFTPPAAPAPPQGMAPLPPAPVPVDPGPARPDPIALRPPAPLDTRPLELAPGRGSRLLLAVVAAVKPR